MKPIIAASVWFVLAFIVCRLVGYLPAESARSGVVVAVIMFFANIIGKLVFAWLEHRRVRKKMKIFTNRD